MASIPRLRLKERASGETRIQPPGRDYRNAKSIREWAYRSGLMPQVFLLKVVRGEVIDGYEPSFRDRFDAAKACVNYFAPSMKTVEVKDGDNAPVQTSSLVLDQVTLDRMTDDELAVLRRALTRLHTGVDANRASQGKEEARAAYKSSLYH